MTIIGTETEYGIDTPADRTVNPMRSSAQLVTAYARGFLPQYGSDWDYGYESPLADARGFSLPRQRAGAELLTDADPTLANVVLTNGARLYVDHAHPEYSAPETTNAWDAMIYDSAGDLVMAAAAQEAEQVLGPVRLYKNNVDNKGASYGAHENYLVDRSLAFDDLATIMIPFLVSRTVLCGAGRVGLGTYAQDSGFQISQRADYIERLIGLETTMKRPVVNTRDEPHADPHRWRRLHVILADANLSQTSILIKVGSAAQVLALAESGRIDAAWAQRWMPRDPVAALRTFSRDLSCTATVELTDGRRVRAVDIQAAYADAVPDQIRTDPATQAWHELIDIVGRDPMLAADRLDWVAKLALLRSYAERNRLGWLDPKLAMIDLQYADVSPHRSLYRRLLAAGRIRRLIDDDVISRAVTEPPADTRAYFRGRCLQRYPTQVTAASWDSVVLDLPDGPQRVEMSDPHRGTAALTGGLFERCPDAVRFFAALTTT